MALFREEYLTAQDDYVTVDPSREELLATDNLGYSNDNLGESTEVISLGDVVTDVELKDLLKLSPDEDEVDEDDDLDTDLDEEDDLDDDDDDIVDFNSSVDPDDDDDLDTDDDLLDDDDDLDDPIISPDLDDEDLDEEDDLLDEEDDDLEDDDTPAASLNTTGDFTSRDHGRTTGTMIDHEPGLPG